MIIKEYCNIDNNDKLKNINPLYYYITKACLENDLDEIKKCKDNVVHILNRLNIDEEEKILKVLHILIKLSMLTNKFDDVVDFFSKEYSYYKNNAEHIVTKAFIKYLDWKNKNEEILSIEKYIMDATCDDEKSILCYMVALTIPDKDFSYEFCLMASKLWDKNMAANIKLIELGKDTDIDINNISKAIELEDNVVKNFKNSTKKEYYNFDMLALGGGDEIGASSYLIKLDGFKALIDVGIKTSKDGFIYPNFEMLKDENGIYEELDGIFITHAHLDHCGALPQIAKIYPNVKIFMTEETKSLIKLNLMSSLPKGETYYLDEVLNRAITLEVNYPLFFRKKNVKVEFYTAGHILGAVSILFEGSKANIFFTGDYSTKEQKTLEGMSVPIDKNIDILVTESTYGDKDKVDHSKTYEYERLKSNVLKYIKENKHILIPTFSIGRAQEVISILKDLAKKEDFRIYVDGSAANVNKLYEKYLNINLKGDNIYYYENLSYNDREDFIQEEFLTNKSVMVSSSGMLLEGSVATYYAKYILPRTDGVCMLTGYQAEDTLGSKLLSQMDINCDRYINIDNECYKLLSLVENYNLSAHASFNDIVALICKLKPANVILTHGYFAEDKSKLQELIENYMDIYVHQSINNNWIRI